MNEDSTAYHAKFSEYSVSHSYQYKQQVPTSSFMRNDRQLVEPSPYAINKLPIIYDSSRQGTPTKGSSRIQYANKEELNGAVNSSPVVKYQVAPFNQQKAEPVAAQGPEQRHSIKPMPISSIISQNQGYPPKYQESSSSRSRTVISGMASVVNASKSEQTQFKVNSSYEPELRGATNISERREDTVLTGRIALKQKQKSGSRLLLERNQKILTTLVGSNASINQNYLEARSVASHFPSESKQIGSELPIMQGLPLKNIQAVSSIPKTNETSKPIGNPLTSGQVYSLSGMPPLPPSNMPLLHPLGNPNERILPVTQPQMAKNDMSFGTSSGLSRTVGISHLSSETVPKIQYQKCVNQCKNWQIKYNELYLKHMNLVSSVEPNNMELHMLKQQNEQLKRQLREQQEKNMRSMPMLQAKFSEMVSNQKQSTIRECMLLIERFKLETRQGRFS